MENTLYTFNSRSMSLADDVCISRANHEIGLSMSNLYSSCIDREMRQFDPSVVMDTFAFSHYSTEAAWSCHTSFEDFAWSEMAFYFQSCFNSILLDSTPSSFFGPITTSSGLGTTSNSLATPTVITTFTTNTTSTLMEDVCPNVDVCPIPDSCPVTDACPIPASMSTTTFTLTADPMPVTAFTHVEVPKQAHTSLSEPETPSFFPFLVIIFLIIAVTAVSFLSNFYTQV
jgi:hypothetical protein